MVGKSTPVVDVETPAVCLDIQLDLQDYGRFSHGQLVVPQPLPDQTCLVSDYLGVVMPNVRIECLGRPSMLQLRREYEQLGPTSLFFDTVHHCFQQHYPLALRPEVLMHLIVQEVATTINLYPDDYRHLFTASEKKTRIDVRHDGLVLGNAQSPWHEVLEMFNLNLREHIPSDLAPSFLPPFSTATQETMAASTVAFMSAVQEYYDFHTHTMCGLPQVRLLGEAGDYTKLREAAENLSKHFAKHLGRYFSVLLPILRTIEQQAQGGPLDKQFWKSLYQFSSESGADVFNYIQIAPSAAYRDEPATAGKIEQKADELFDWSPEAQHFVPGINVGSVPSQVSVAPFQWHYFDQVLPMQFVGGVLGIDNVDGYATPALSYAVAHTA